jgi:hypothetical protein
LLADYASREAQGIRFSDRIISLLKNGPPLVLYKIRKLLVFPIISKRQWEFTFNGRKYRYFYHTHNETWRNERIVEIPIVWAEVQKHDAKRVLEFGSVLPYYFPVNHCVVDKYDRRAGVNVDILDLRLPKKYDLIVSISTLEHVGFNEGKYAGHYQVTPHSAEKIRQAIDVLQDHLSPHGKLIITAPLGYNPEFDDLLRKHRIFTGAKYLKRISRSNKWIEVREGAINNVKYGAPYTGASALAICFFEQESHNDH